MLYYHSSVPVGHLARDVPYKVAALAWKIERRVGRSVTSPARRSGQWVDIEWPLYFRSRAGGTTVRVASLDEFTGFGRPGFVKVIERFRLAPIGEADTVVVDELAARCTDAVTARRFRRYWRVIAPGSRLVRHQLLAATADLAEA